MIEIEHKYLLKHAPVYIGVNPQTIVQHFIDMNEDYYIRLTEMVKPKNPSYAMAIKSKEPMLARTEVTAYIQPNEYFDMLSLARKDTFIAKRRYKLDGWDIDEFLYPHDLWVAEYEVANEKDAVAFPTWLLPYVDHEVTGDRRYYGPNILEFINA